MGKKKGQKANAAAESDDALLDAAIAENKAQAVAAAEAKAAAAEAAAIAARQEAAARIEGLNFDGLSQEAVVEKLSGIPTFAVMHDTPTGKKFVPMLFKDDDQDEGVTSCAFFADPNEAKNTLLQAKSQHPDMNLAIGVMPLGKAFALCAGWAEAKSQRTPFTLRAAQPAAKQMRPILKKQLEVINLPSFWSFPVFLCEELQSPACLPVFLTREGLMETWAGTGKGTAAPANVTVTDLRVIVSEMQKGFKETGCDWSIVRFLGSEEGWSAIKDQVEGESGAPGGVSKGGGEAPAGEQRAGPADPDAEPPKLE
jgi:hypothetical protein